MIDHQTDTWQVGDITIRPATLDDIPHVVAISRAHDVYVRGVSTYDEAEAREELTEPNFDVEASVRLAFAPDGTCVGIGIVYDQLIQVRPNLWGFVLPEYRSRGLGSALLGWQIDRARTNLTRIPEDAKLTIQGWVVSHDESGAQLFRDHGFTTQRAGYTMKIDFTPGQCPPAPEWPEGAQVVSLAEHGDFEMFVRGWYESFRDHRGWMERKWEDVMARWTHMVAHDHRHNPAHWWAVLIDGELAAVALCNAEGYDREDYAYVMVLGTLRGFRKRGLAMGLLRHAFNAFYDLGKGGVTLGVDGTSLTGAVRLYEAAGMHISERRDTYERVERDGIELTNQG